MAGDAMGSRQTDIIEGRTTEVSPSVDARIKAHFADTEFPEAESEAAVEDGLVGQIVGRYEVMSTIGAGGMGSVFRAFDRQLKRVVALKAIRRGRITRARSRFLREARALAQVNHESTVQILDYISTKSQDFIVMEFVSGADVSRWLAESRTEAEVIHVFVDAAAGIAAMHEAGIVHRDLKPSNILVSDDGRGKVTDFGLAGALADEHVEEQVSGDVVDFESSLTEAGAIVGTPAYMAPEQLVGHGATARSDQFSYCVSLYEALFGERPVRDAAGDSLFMPTLRSFRSTRVVHTVLARGLKTNPAERWPSMRKLHEVLRQAIVPNQRRMLIGVTGAVASVGCLLAWYLLGQLDIAQSDVMAESRKRGLARFVDELTATHEVNTHILAMAPRLRAILSSDDVGDDTIYESISESRRRARADVFLVSDRGGWVLFEDTPSVMTYIVESGIFPEDPSACVADTRFFAHEGETFLLTRECVASGDEALGSVVLGRSITSVLGDIWGSHESLSFREIGAPEGAMSSRGGREISLEVPGGHLSIKSPVVRSKFSNFAMIALLCSLPLAGLGAWGVWTYQRGGDSG